MEEKRIKKTEALKALIDGVNIYTGERVEGIDGCLKKDLQYIYEYLSNKVKNKEQSTNSIETKNVEQKLHSEGVKSIVLRSGRIEIDGQKFRIDDGNLYDSTGMRLPEAKADTLLHRYYSTINYKLLDEENLLEYIKSIKNSRLYNLCVTVIESELYNEHEEGFIRSILPIYTSSLRELKMASKVVSFWESNRGSLCYYESAAFFTSLASAYCDIKDYVTAKQYADRAYAMSGGSKGYQTEISLVYNRIKKENG